MIPLSSLITRLIITWNFNSTIKIFRLSCSGKGLILKYPGSLITNWILDLNDLTKINLNYEFLDLSGRAVTPVPKLIFVLTPVRRRRIEDNICHLIINGRVGKGISAQASH